MNVGSSRFYHQNQSPRRGEVDFEVHHGYPSFLSHNNYSRRVSTVDNGFYRQSEQRHHDHHNRHHQYPPPYQHRRCSSSSSIIGGVVLRRMVSQQHFYDDHDNSMSSPTQDARDVADDRILPPPGQGQALSSRTYRYETTADGDVVITDPAFDDVAAEVDNPAAMSTTTTSSTSNSWQSPGMRAAKRHNRHHSRNLSAHFFDATKLTEDDDEAQVKKTFAKVKPEVDAPPFPPPSASPSVGQKHRRMFSGDVSNPPVAHRRINSIGNAAAVDRFLQRPRGRHRREDSAGLDILSAAADATTDELADAAGARSTPPNYWGEPPQAHHTRLSSLDYYDYGPAPTARPPGPMKPPPSRSFPHPHTTPHPHAYGPPPTMASYHHPHHHPHYPPPPGWYPPPPGHAAPPPPPPSRSTYPVQYSHRAPPPDVMYKYPPVAEEPSGRQPSPTEPPYGDAKIESDEKLFESKTTSADPSDPLMTKSAAAVSNSHHRKLSSFSSIGALMGSSIFSPGEGGGDHPLKKKHHRQTSSTVSFLQGLDVLEGSDVMFLRNLHAATPAYGGGSSAVPPLAPPSESTATVAFAEPSKPTEDNENATGLQLAAGGTSKRVRRKCTVGDCPNRVVQGGLCISHGAKRKTCKHPGCTKNVKKAGLCSTHGPARKRCDAEGCSKVAVQGGRCIAHGAKKKLCSVENCKKQAILSGMCKKHHDKLGGMDPNAPPVCVVISGGGDGAENAAKPAHKSGHTRGLSIFQDLSADAVQNLLAGDDPLSL